LHVSGIDDLHMHCTSLPSTARKANGRLKNKHEGVSLFAIESPIIDHILWVDLRGIIDDHLPVRLA